MAMNPSSATETDDREVAALAAHAEQGHSALMRGDLDSYFEHLRTSDDFLLMAPFGGEPTRGGDLTSERWAAVGRFFAHGRQATSQLLHAWRSGDMAALATIERAHVEVGGLAAQDWALRVTLVFRRQQGRWLLVHRHADPLVGAIGLTQAAALARGAAIGP
jgi:ketosteroid isomerase-like protein